MSWFSEIQRVEAPDFRRFAAEHAKLDMLRLDGRLMPDDLKLLGQLIKDDPLIALDDCKGDEKGHMNLDYCAEPGSCSNTPTWNPSRVTCSGPGTSKPAP